MATPAPRIEGTPVTEAAALAGVAVFSLVAGRFLAAGEISMEAKLIVGLPIAVSALAIFTHEREVVWIALGLCLSTGVIGFFSVGMPVFLVGICLFLWWLRSSRRLGRPVVTGSDLVWEMVGVSIILVALGLPIR